MNKLNKFSSFEALVIGGSAGGIEALLKFLPLLPSDFPLPIMIALHVPADSTTNLLLEVFRSRVSLPVLEGGDKESIIPGNIYFAPPNYHLLIERDRSLALSNEEPVHFSRPSIDVLFESAALVYRQHLIGLLLSGANSDGAYGLKRIKEMGGFICVQDPNSASAPEMPRSAIQLLSPDQIIPPEQISGLLNRLSGYKRLEVNM